MCIITVNKNVAKRLFSAKQARRNQSLARKAKRKNILKERTKMKFTSVRKFACVLSLTSIFSIGFASWTSFTPMQELTLSGNTISADEVNYPIEYFGIKKKFWF